MWWKRKPTVLVYRKVPEGPLGHPRMFQNL